MSPKSKWNGALLKGLLKHLSLEQCIEYLMSGYLKQNATKLQCNIYPFYLEQISIQYLGGKKFFIRFKHCTNRHNSLEYINEYHAIISKQVRYEWGTFLIDLPIPVQNVSHKISWNVKLNTKCLVESDWIGIVPDTFTYFGWTVWGLAIYDDYSGCNGDHIYGVCSLKIQKTENGDKDWKNNSRGIIWNGKKCDHPELYSTVKKNIIVGKSNYESNQIVHCEYDGNLKEFKISKLQNKELICRFRIEESSDNIKFFYPAISLWCKKDAVQIM